jgi:hypothetical protein
VLFSLNHEVVNQLLALDNQVIDSFAHQFKIKASKERTFFLKLDGVNNTDVMLPDTVFNMVVNVNYNCPKSTMVRLEVRDKLTNIIAGSLSIRLNGEDVASFSLSPVFREKVWIPQVDLYYLNDKRVWCLSDCYLSGRRVYSPVIRKSIGRVGLYEVESFSVEGKFYVVDLVGRKCSCPAYAYGRVQCKHLQVVEKISAVHLDGGDG